MKILGLQANLLGANPGMAKSHAYWTRTLVILAFLIGWVEGEDVPSSCLECPNQGWAPRPALWGGGGSPPRPAP